jgi:hypothetical protein
MPQMNHTMFMLTLLLSEGQAGEVWEPLNHTVLSWISVEVPAHRTYRPLTDNTSDL